MLSLQTSIPAESSAERRKCRSGPNAPEPPPDGFPPFRALRGVPAERPPGCGHAPTLAPRIAGPETPEQNPRHAPSWKRRPLPLPRLPAGRRACPHAETVATTQRPVSDWAGRTPRGNRGMRLNGGLIASTTCPAGGNDDGPKQRVTGLFCSRGSSRRHRRSMDRVTGPPLPANRKTPKTGARLQHCAEAYPPLETAVTPSSSPSGRASGMPPRGNGGARL